MALTPVDFKTEYECFGTVPDAKVALLINRFSCIYQGDYGCQADYLAGLWVAHSLYVAGRRGGGPVNVAVGKTVGDTSIQYAQSSGAASAMDFAASKWGLEFWRQISLFGGGPLITGGGHVTSQQGY